MWWRRAGIAASTVAAVTAAFFVGAPPGLSAPTPTVTAVNPSSGPTSGLRNVSVYGTDFTGVTGVSFGTTTVRPSRVVSPTQLVVNAPDHAAGTVDVRVATTSGQSAIQAADHFTYIAAPTVTYVSPNLGSTLGGLKVTLTGTDFVNVTGVTFGGASATNVQVDQSGTSLTVFTPPRSKAGTVTVQVTTAYGASQAVAASQFAYYLPPSITAVNPNVGSQSGGDQVTVTGANFLGVVSVTFGGVIASIVAQPIPTSVVVRTPVHAPGTVDVRVTGAFGSSAITKAAQFTYLGPPVVSSVSPNNGPMTGNTRVTINGSDFINVSSVTFGGTSATIRSVSPTSLSVVTPAHMSGPGTVDVRVFTSYGQSAVVAADKFTYVGTPIVTAVSPTRGPTAGGTTVQVTGSDFVSVTSVTFGGRAATILSASPNSLTVRTPSHAPGTFDVQVVNIFGTSAVVAADKFTFIDPPTITAISPTSGVVRGGLDVSLTGTNFIDVISVTFGGVEAKFAPMYFPNSLSVAPPAHAAGTVDIRVTTAYGTSRTVFADRYTYSTAPGWSVGSLTHNLQGGPRAISCTSSTFCVLVEGNYATYNGATWTAPTWVGMGSGLTGVSCLSPTFCVGVSDDGSVVVWNGASWLPPLGKHVDDVAPFNAVSCVSGFLCVAVDDAGNAFTTTDAATWVGPVSVDGQALTSVSCASPTFCLAVSSDGNAIVYNGSTWSTPTNVVPMGLTGVSCVSPTFCVAVHAVGEVWTYDGSAWTLSFNADNGSFTGVSCPAASFCVVTGGNGSVVRLDGTTWSGPYQVDPLTDLTGVSCPTSAFCAVFTNSFGRVETFDGLTWSAPVKVDNDNGFSGVDCLSSTFCVVTDSDANVFMWNGTTWSAPINLGKTEYGLGSPSCVSPTFCLIPGWNGVYVWNGTSWSAPIDIDQGGGIAAVSCVSTTFCVAVDGGPNVLMFNGTTWSDPREIDPDNGTSDVSCTSPTFCVVVDQGGNALTWDGLAWSDPIHIDDSYLSGVSCTSETFCIAVDHLYTEDGSPSPGSALIWNGSSWSAPATIDSVQLNDVSCASPTFCIAVDDNGFALTWNGTSWTSPTDVSGGGGGIGAVSCSPTGYCMAVRFDWTWVYY